MKKVLSFVLVLALVLGSFSMAFAAPAAGLSDVAGNANEDAINVANGLGIITGYDDGTYLPTKAVTRAEYAAMITRALGIPESALAGYKATTFKDTVGYGWAVPYLAFCESKGIMEGDGNGIVRPGETVTISEAVTMACRAIGITNDSAWLVGTWPGNYVTVAKSLGLYEDVAASTTVDRAAAAQVIYNLLTCDQYAVDKDGATTVIGGVNAKSLIESLGATSTTTAALQYNVDSKILLNDYIGAAAKVYKDADGDIIAVEPTNKIMTGQFDGATFTADGVEYTVVGGTPAAVNSFVNNAYVGASTVNAIAQETDVKVAAKTDGKNITINSVMTWEVSAIVVADEDTAADIADDKALGGVDFRTNSSKEIIATSYELLGVDSLDKIAEDNIVYVYEGDNYITKVEVGTKTVTGTVTKITSGTTTKYAIDGVNYVVATSGSAAGLALGTEGTATLDYAGDIYSFEVAEEAMPNYAIVIGTQATGSFGTTSYAIKFFTTEGKTVEAACNATVNAFQPNDIFKYSLKDDGSIKSATTVAALELTNQAVTANGALIGTYAVASDVIVMVYDNSDDEWGLKKMADLDDTVSVSAITNSSAKIAIVIAQDTELADADTDDSYGLVTKKNETTWVAADEESVQLLDILVAGAAKTGVLTDALSTYTGDVDANAPLQVITIDEDGVVTNTTNASVASISAVTVTAVSGNIVTLNGTASYELAANVVVYAWDSDDEVWTIIKVADLEDETNVYLYDTDTDSDADGYEIVIVR